MAFKVPDALAGNGGLGLDGDVQTDAFDNITRIVTLPAGVPLPIGSLPSIAAGTFLANITAGSAVPTDHPLATFAGIGLTYTNVTGVLDWDGVSVRKNSAGSVFTRPRINLIEGTNVTLTVADDGVDGEVDVTITSAVSSIADDTFLANVTGAPAIPTGKTFTSLAGDGLSYDAANHELDVNGSTSITITSDEVRRAALSGAIVAAANANTTVFAGIKVDGVATTDRTNINFISGSNVVLTPTDDAGNDEIEITIAASAGGGLTPISDERMLGNDSGVAATPVATTIHQALDWIGGEEQWLFDGSNDFVDFGNVHAFERTDPFTLSVWTNASFYFGKALPTSISSTQRGYAFQLNSGGNIAIRLNGNIAAGGTNALVINSTATVTVTETTHFALTYDGSSTAAGVTVYVNGVSVALTNVSASVTVTIVGAAHLCLGGKEDGVATTAGIQKHAAIWSSALTGAQVLEVYNSAAPPDLNALPTAPVPVFWAKMDDDDATGAGGIIDYGTGGDDGTAQNGLAPGTAVGNLPVRGSTAWQLIAPGASGISLTSNGVNSLPSFRQMGLNGLPSMAAGTFLANITAGSAVPTAHTLSTLAGDGLTYTNVTGILAVGSSTSITVNANDIQRAALTGAVTAAANTNATAFGALAAKSVLANATNGSAVPAALAGSAAFQYLRVNSANTALEWAILSLAAFPTMAAGSVLANVTAGVAVPTAHDLATLAGGGLTYTNVTGIMAVGAGTGITVNANDVQLSTIAADSFFVNGTGSPAVATAIAGATVAGAGLTYTTGGILAVGAGAAITVNANDVAVSDNGITPAKLAIIASSVAPTITIYASYAAGAGGSADDVSIFTSNAPFNFRITEVIVYTATAVALSTVTLRSATAGGGSALSSAISTTIAGQTSNNNTATVTVASASSLVIRRSDSGIAGEVVIFGIKT